MAQFNQLQTSASQVINPPADFVSFYYDDQAELRFLDHSGPYVPTASIMALTASIAEDALQLAAGDKVITGSLTVSSSMTVIGRSVVSGTFEVTRSMNSPQVSASFFSGSAAGITEVSASSLSVLTASIDNLTILGTASIKYLNVDYQSSSVIFSSGSNIFGDAQSDTQQFTGSVGISGSLTMDTASVATLRTTVISQSLSVTGTLALKGNQTTSGSLTVTGSTTITGSLGISGSTLSVGIIGIVSGSGSFSGSGANLYDISASAIVGLNLARISSGSFSASIYNNNGTGSMHINAPIFVTNSLTVGYASGSSQVSGANMFGTASWAVDALFGAPAVVVSGSYPTTQRNIATGSASGSLWWNNDDGNLYIQSQGPTGSVWVPAMTTVAGSTFGATYTNTYAAATTWSVVHGLGTLTPLIQVYSGSTVIAPGTIRAVDTNTTQILFSTAVSGTVIASTGIGGPTSSSYALTSTTALTASYAHTASYTPNAALKVSGSWTIVPGDNVVSFTLQSDQMYSMWAKANVPNSILVWHANGLVTNSNVYILGSQMAGSYPGVGGLSWKKLPPDFTGSYVGSAGVTGSVVNIAGATSFDVRNITFTIGNSSANTYTMYWGYSILS